MSGLIGWNNEIDGDGVALNIIGAGDELTPIDWLRTRQLGKGWRVINADGNAGDDPDGRCGIRVTFESARRIRMLGLLNFSQVSYLARNNMPHGVRLYGDHGILLATIAGNSLPYVSGQYESPPTIVYALDEEIEGVYRIDYSWAWDAGDAADSWDLGRLWASRALEFDDGFDEGWSMHWSSDGVRQRSRSGSVYVQPAPRWRTTSFSHGLVPRELVLPEPSFDIPPLSIKQLAADVGNTGEALVVLRQYGSDEQETTVYGSFPDGIGYEEINGEHFSVAWKHEEER